MPDNVQELWVKEVISPISKQLSQWRDELYGYWMVISDVRTVDGIEIATAMFYGTDKEAVYDKCDILRSSTGDITCEVLHNKRSNWVGGAFLAKHES